MADIDDDDFRSVLLELMEADVVAEMVARRAAILMATSICSDDNDSSLPPVFMIQALDRSIRHVDVANAYRNCNMSFCS